MKRSYLIQRLLNPSKFSFGKVEVKDNPFAFGGGLKNGGLSEDAMNLVRDVFSFDYMGSAEFEFGAVPEALKKMVDTPLVTSLVHTGIGSGVVHFICKQDCADEVRSRICEWAAGEPRNTKESVGLNRALKGEKYSRAVGWLELDNGFMFFIDQGMFEKVCELFGIESKSLTANQPLS